MADWKAELLKDPDAICKARNALLGCNNGFTGLLGSFCPPTLKLMELSRGFLESYFPFIEFVVDCAPPSCKRANNDFIELPLMPASRDWEPDTAGIEMDDVLYVVP